MIGYVTLKSLADECEKWCFEHNMELTPFDIILFLHIHNMLDGKTMINFIINAHEKKDEDSDG